MLKLISFLLYILAFFCFLYYVQIFYTLNNFMDQWFNHAKNCTFYDYIIVGAGTAGATVAARLSDINEKVLLIEAGDSALPFSNIPLITPLLQGTPYDWQYKTVPQRNSCKGLVNRQSIWAAGKILGGSSRLNYMAHVRGHPEDYEFWLPDFQGLFDRLGETRSIEKQKWHSKISESVLQGIEELSYARRNINQKNNTGFMKVSLMMKNGERWGADRLLKKENADLTILTNALVLKVLFDLKKAIGVRFSKHNSVYEAYARKGVILSAGAVGSPKLLMLSGVGPRKHLKEHNIDVVEDLPVGQNLKDHLITGLDLVLLNQSAGIEINDAINPLSFIKYFYSSTGPWTSSAIDIVGTFHSKFPAKTSRPDLQVMVLTSGVSQDGGVVLRKNLGIPDEDFRKYYEPIFYKSVISIVPVLLHPKSVGEIKLRSKNPLDPPIIDPNYLSHKQDSLTLIEGIKFIKNLIRTKALKKYGAKMYDKLYPGCERHVFDSEEYWECYVRHLTLTTYHPTSTCSIGNVVDSNFRVYKTENLFVIDGSVIPVTISGNPNASILMLAEKAAALIVNGLKEYAKSLNRCRLIDVFLTFNICL